MVTASDSAAALDSIYLLRVAFNYWVVNYMACLIFEVIVCPVAVDAPI